jgi:hypothetical protein
MYIGDYSSGYPDTPIFGNMAQSSLGILAGLAADTTNDLLKHARTYQIAHFFKLSNNLLDVICQKYQDAASTSGDVGDFLDSLDPIITPLLPHRVEIQLLPPDDITLFLTSKAATRSLHQDKLVWFAIYYLFENRQKFRGQLCEELCKKFKDNQNQMLRELFIHHWTIWDL